MSSPQPPAAKSSILIVDDTPNNLRLLSGLLTQQGYEVRSAISGAMALMAVQKALPDLILMDVNMPQMNGYETCVQLKTDDRTRDIPVIFLSAMTEVSDKIKAFQAGGVDYITKPFSVAEVLARVETQLSLRQMQTQLQQALAREQELNQIKSEFISLVTHDFRTPLASIQGFAGLLQNHQSQLTPELQQRYFSKIDESIEHLLFLLDEVLLMGSLDAGKIRCQPEPVQLAELCHNLIEAVQMSQSTTPPIRFSHTGHETVALDPMLVRQILTNLLSNAIKYSPEQAPIDFQVHGQPEGAAFRIQDRGIGIPLEGQSQLFEPFYRCRNVGKTPGTGLGLAIVKRCVEAHGGTIDFISQEGEGTTVEVQLSATGPIVHLEPISYS